MWVLRWLDHGERGLRVSRPAWRWLGQVAIVVLGVHLVADRLDDLVYDSVIALGLPGVDPQGSALFAAWLGVGLEVALALWSTWTLWVAAQVPASSWRDWRREWSIAAIVRPVYWLPVALAGCWVLGMAVEDALVPVWAPAAGVVGRVVALLAAWRLGLTGWWTVARAVRTHNRRIDGWWLAVPLLAVAATAARHGLPIWGAW